MVSFRNIAQAAAIFGLASAMPAPASADIVARQTPVQNNTQEFWLTLETITGPTTYNGWILEAYHTGAGLADPVFAATPATPAFLNSTQLQFDQKTNIVVPFSVTASVYDGNYARWEPVTISSGYGTAGFVNTDEGIIIDSEEFAGWLVCEWYHSDNAPQLFQLINGFVGTDPFPSTCSTVQLIPVYF